MIQYDIRKLNLIKSLESFIIMITVRTDRRRSWDEPPPPMDKESPYWPGRDDRYRQLGKYTRVCTCMQLFVFKEQSLYFFNFSV